MNSNSRLLRKLEALNYGAVTCSLCEVRLHQAMASMKRVRRWNLSNHFFPLVSHLSKRRGECFYSKYILSVLLLQLKSPGFVLELLLVPFVAVQHATGLTCIQ